MDYVSTLPNDLILDILTFLSPAEVKQIDYDPLWSAIISNVFKNNNTVKEVSRACKQHLEDDSLSCCNELKDIFWKHLAQYLDPATGSSRVLTDRERLLSACSALCKRGIETRIDFSCCGSCAHREIQEEIQDIRDQYGERAYLVIVCPTPKAGAVGAAQVAMFTCPAMCIGDACWNTSFT